MNRQAPLLSIGIIFKNEIRCLERCLKSLQLLRESIPCELVMADTGADDGSREVAEKYADILIDFPWVNDFSAARNAVMDRCSGKWYMSIDCDEWVDPNIEGYAAFLTRETDFDFASVVVRNYNTFKLDKGGSYSDFLATRFLRMSTGIRYEGAVHEHWMYKGDLRTMMIRGAVFHHDGYVYQNKELMKAKRERNLPLLLKKLEDKPKDLIVLNQCVEGSADMPEQEGYLRRALVGVGEKWSQWELFGPSLYRYAVRLAMRDHLPELEEWISQAESMFPDSIFLRVEIAYFAFGHYWSKDDYGQAIRWGERYLQGAADYHAGRFDRADLLASALDKIDIHSRMNVAVVLAEGYLHEEQPEKCAQLLESLDAAGMDTNQVQVGLRDICRLCGEFWVDTAPLMLRFWERLNEPEPDREAAAQRRAAFLQAGFSMFTREYREGEDAQFYGHAYTAFLPLADCCGLGVAAAIMECGDRPEIEQLLRSVEDWNELPGAALEHALSAGVVFPLHEKPLKIEEIDLLAGRLAQDKDSLEAFLSGATAHLDEGPQALGWSVGLALAALKGQDWEDRGNGMDIVRSFAAAERAFLPAYYAPAMLCEEQIRLLPPLHRFGWYCTRAFDALDAGDTAGYVHCLREGLAVCEGVKAMVEFLLEHTPQLQAPPPSVELLELAEKVRAILSAYPPDDPSVLALKQTPVYQQVVHLIEGPDTGLYGGLKQ